MAYPRYRAARSHKSFLRTAGNLTLNSTSWADLPTVGTTWDLVLAAQVGDTVEVGLSARIDSEAVELYLDVVTIVSAAAVTSVGNQAAPSSTTRGVSAWTGIPSVVGKAAGSALYTLVSADISSGTVTLRLRYRTSSATNKVLNAVADYPLHFWGKNLGPADPN